MKVIGTGAGDVYICEVKHSELEKFLGLYYGNMKRLANGAVVDLSKGHDFLSDTRAALKKTEEFISANRAVITAITNGISVFSGLADKEEVTSGNAND